MKRIKEKIKFTIDNRYFLNVNNPRTFNEKIHYRKINCSNEMFVICSDKIAVKEYVKSKFEDILIPTYYNGPGLSVEEIKKLVRKNGSLYIKANHNSGPVHMLKLDSSESDYINVVESINGQLEIDYGKKKNEPWYSKIKPQVLIEKRIESENGNVDLNDYKFHVFKRLDGTFNIILHVDFDRSSNHHRSFYDEKLNWLPFSNAYPSIKTNIEKPKNYERMLEIVKELATPFSYVRVDLYNVDGDIYFGEMTFAHQSGNSPFSSYEYDLWMGNLWECDPSF